MYFAKHNLGQVFQAPKVNDFQGEAFARVQVGAGISAEEREAERAIKTVVRYHDGNYFLAIINNRLNEQLPITETSASTLSYGRAGENQRFIATDNIRIILPENTVLENCVELSATIAGNEASQTLTTQNIIGIGNKQVLTLSSLGAAETRLFRFRAAAPIVTVAPMVLAVQNEQNDKQHSEITSSSFPEKHTSSQQSKSEDFTVFPNPATESATLRFPIKEEGESLMLTIADMYGNVLVRTEVQSQELLLPTRLLPSGVYVCSVQGKKRFWNTLLHVIK